MHRDDGADALVKVVSHGLVADVDRHKGGLPVVAMHHVRLLRKGGQQLCHRAGEESEALAVVIVAVKLSAAEVALIVDKIPRDALVFEGEQAAVDLAPGKAHIGPAFKVQFLSPFVLHRLVKRQDDAHAVARCRE